MAQQRSDSVQVPANANKDSSNVALRAFFRIAEAWKLNTDEQMVLLGSPARSTFFKLKKEGGSLSQDTLERISYILGIYQALQILLPETESADDWMRKPNTASIFNGEPALKLMLGGRVADLYVVRRYLDAQRGA
jgi:Protein of unknown function (DUF2384)